MPELAALRIGDPPEAWADLGFVVDAGGVNVSGVRHVLDGAGSGVTGWSFRGLDDTVDAVDGAGTGHETAPAAETPDHPNGVVQLDHLVLTSPDLDRTIAAFEEAGLRLRRTRDTGTAERPLRQAFFRAGEVILELVGPRSTAGEGPLRFGGLAWTVRDMEATAAFYGDRLRPAKDAVQPGRRIATLDRAAGSTVAMAFMTADR